MSFLRVNVGKGMDLGGRIYEELEDFYMREVFSSEVVWGILRYYF